MLKRQPNLLPSDPKGRTMDPKAIMFSVSTICNDLAPDELRQSDFAFYEDDWSQVALISQSQLVTVVTV
jgi:hypothetical protein